MTIRDLKEMLRKISDDEILDLEIRSCFEETDSGIICEGVWFDIQEWADGFYPTVTVCDTKENYLIHDGCTPWDRLPKYRAKKS